MRALEPFGDDIQQAFVFGSVAKGSDHGRSDIDLAVIGRVTLREVTNVLLDLEQELGRPIHLNLYDPEEWEELISSDRVMAQIAEGPKLELIRHAEAA